MPSTPPNESYPLQSLSHRSSSSSLLNLSEDEAGPSRSRTLRSNGLGYSLGKGRKKRLSDEDKGPEHEEEGVALLRRDKKDRNGDPDNNAVSSRLTLVNSLDIGAVGGRTDRREHILHKTTESEG